MRFASRKAGQVIVNLNKAAVQSRPDLLRGAAHMIESISAITLGTHDMGRAVHFYRSLGFELLYGGEACYSPAFAPAPAIST